MIRKIAQALARRKVIREILENPADLSEFRERPTPRLILGLVLMAFSYVMGWPAIAAFGILAAWFKNIWIAAVGPISYGLSCLIFLLGAWLARAPHYLSVLGRYAVCAIFRKALRKNNCPEF